MARAPESELTENEYVVTHRVSSTGDRLDAFLKERYRRRSRAQIQRAIDDGAIFISRTQSPHLALGRLKASTQLIEGDEVQVVSERKPEPPVCFDYKVLYEDTDLLVIDKPANLPVHPAGKYFFNTLLIHLRTEAHTRNRLEAKREYFLVHRIDKETSGVLVLARSRELCAELVKQFVDRKTEKRYLAIVHGNPRETFVVDAPLMREPGAAVALKMAVGAETDGAVPALTRFERLRTKTILHHGRLRELSLVRCFPKTGRQHQIRVHLEHAGHPIVGDKLYGMPADDALRFFNRQFISPEAESHLILPRHALHAESIGFADPRTRQIVRFTAPLPADMASLIGE